MSCESFMLHFTALTHPQPFVRRQRLWGDGDRGWVVFEVSPGHLGRYVSFDFIQTLTKGQGHGTEGLKWLCAVAQEHGVQLRGSVKRVGTSGLTQSELRRWYKRHGFVVRRNGELEYWPNRENAAA